MSKAVKKYLDQRQVLKIDEFLKNYVDKNCETRDLLTHRDMCIYLEDKYNIYLEKIIFKNVKFDKILTGEYIMVKDNFNKVKIYKNPMKSLELLQFELNSKENKEKVKKSRVKVLNQLGLLETNSEVLDKKLTEKEEYNLEKPNRQKQFVISNHSYYRKRHY